MVTVTIEGSKAVFELQHMHKVWALRSRLEVPLMHITSVHRDPDLTLGLFDRLKLMGAYLPGIFAAGTFWEHGGLVFMDVTDPARTVVVDLQDETYKRLVVEVEDPGAVVTRLRQVIGKA